MSELARVDSRSYSALLWRPIAGAKLGEHGVAMAAGVVFSVVLTSGIKRFVVDLRGWKQLAAGGCASLPIYYALLHCTRAELVRRRIDSCPSETLRKGLDNWLDNESAWGRKVEACQRILDAYDSHSNSLCLGNLRLNSMPAGLEELTHLRRLSLAINFIQYLPPDIGRLNHLEVLSLFSNYLLALSPEIGRLTRLQRLDLSQNQLEELPEEICNLRELTALDLNINVRLRRLPDHIGRLTQLKTLDLYGCPMLTGLPGSMANLPLTCEVKLEHTGVPHAVQAELLTQRTAAIEPEGGPSLAFNADPLREEGKERQVDPLNEILF